jgi:hypothetical protein
MIQFYEKSIQFTSSGSKHQMSILVNNNKDNNNNSSNNKIILIELLNDLIE